MTNSRIFFKRATPGGNKFLVAAGVDSKPGLLGTIGATIDFLQLSHSP
jgi:hypothetical protein